jgi:hypothetical protein
MSVTSSTDIANLALDLLNAGTVNNIVTGTNPTEAMLRRWYDQARRKVLREHPWNFAIKRATLAASSTAPAFEYSSAFPVPSDFIRLCVVQNGDGYIYDRTSYTYENNSILINSDSGALRIRYVYDIEDVNKFDPLFVDLLVLELALCVAYKMSDNNTNIQRIGELQRMRSAVARAIDGQESPPQRREVSRNVTARRMGSSRLSHRINFDG